MGKFDRYELQGAEREQTLREIEEQVSAWGLRMPAVTPVPFHFGLNRYREIGECEFWIANETESGYCGKFLFLFDGQTCPYHHHRIKHETFFILKGRIRMKTGDEERILEQGDLLAMPPGVGHSFTGIGPALVLEASMPSLLEDNFFADPNIGDNGVI